MQELISSCHEINQVLENKTFLRTLFFHLGFVVFCKLFGATELHKHSVQGLYSICVERKRRLKISCPAGASLP